MAEEKRERAQKVFATVCEMLDSHNWHYEKDEEKMRISCQARGDDFPIGIVFRVHEDRQLLTLLSHLPFTISEEKRLDAAIATSIVNYALADGSFDLDITDGHMFFRLTSSFIESEIGIEAIDYMLAIAGRIVDEFNDKFFMLSKGVIGVEEFIKMTSSGGNNNG